MEPANPFADYYGEPVFVEDVAVTHAKLHASVTEIFNTKIATFPVEVEVPILDMVRKRSLSSESSASTLNSADEALSPPSSPPTLPAHSALTEWNTLDLLYLIYCLLPNLIGPGELFWSPPLEELEAISGPFHLQLYQRIQVVPAPAAAYSRYAPIGTGRPSSKLLLAESARGCKNAHAARKSLAKNMLGNGGTVWSMIHQYKILAEIYGSSKSTRESLLRGMLAMRSTSEYECIQRYRQLCAGVDGNCELEPKLEVFLLHAGRDELDVWIKNLTEALKRGEQELGRYGREYTNAAAFLTKVIREVIG